MTKTLNISSLIPTFILSVFLMLSVFVAFPADAAETKIKEGCELTRTITLSDGTVHVEGIEITTATDNWGTLCLINTVNAVTDWAFFILISVAFVFILFAGFLFMTAGAKPENKEKAGAMIGAALIGIVIAILARVIPGVVTGIML